MVVVCTCGLNSYGVCRFGDVQAERCHRSDAVHLYLVLSLPWMKRALVVGAARVPRGTAEMATSILDRFIEHSIRFQDDPAIFINDRSYTYGELRNLCSSICSLL